MILKSYEKQNWRGTAQHKAYPNSNSQTMARNRFQLIFRYFHFNNTTAGTNTDHLYKIKPVLNITTEKFKINFIPEKEVFWCGRCTSIFRSTIQEIS